MLPSVEVETNGQNQYQVFYMLNGNKCYVKEMGLRDSKEDIEEDKVKLEDFLGKFFCD